MMSLPIQKNKAKTYFQLQTSGFTILFAVLVSSLVLAVGIGIANITLKEILLSGAGRDSQFAFYAADTGTECALYWDVKGNNVFATSTDTSAGAGTGYRCVDTADIATNPDWTVTRGPSSATTTFQIKFSEGYCATVSVTKMDVRNADGSAGQDGIPDITTIDARGYNTCDTTNPRRVERGLRISY